MEIKHISTLTYSFHYDGFIYIYNGLMIVLEVT